MINHVLKPIGKKFSENPSRLQLMDLKAKTNNVKNILLAENQRISEFKRAVRQKFDAEILIRTFIKTHLLR